MKDFKNWLIVLLIVVIVGLLVGRDNGGLNLKKAVDSGGLKIDGKI